MFYARKNKEVTKLPIRGEVRKVYTLHIYIYRKIGSLYEEVRDILAFKFVYHLGSSPVLTAIPLKKTYEKT